MAEDKLTINGMDEGQFLKAYNHKEKTMAEVGLDWSDLVSMHDYYKNNVMPDFDIIANKVWTRLKSIKGAYIVTYRLKDPEHVVNKAIRKMKEDQKLVTKDNFIEVFDDLIGLRILHHFKNDWESIYKSLCSMYDSNEQPKAYHKNGDREDLINRYKELGLNPIVKPAGYRSIHYIARVPFFSQVFRCEIQIRTEFEDAWSEIDHIVRNPNELNNPVFNKYLLMFNSFASSADDMGTFLMYLKGHMEDMKAEHDKMNATIAELRDEVDKMNSEKASALMRTLDSSMGTLNPLMNETLYPSTVDILERIKNPSGSTVSTLGALSSFSALDAYLQSHKENPGDPAIGSGSFRMPKAIDSSILWGSHKKNDKNEE